MAKAGLFQSRESYRLALPVMVFLYLVTQIPRAKELVLKGAGLTPDDAMRLTEVRDLLNGQGWYDLFQHRVLPPGGLSMHWSRYIDGPMAAIMSALQPLLGPDMAGRGLAIIWPLVMGVTFMLMSARLTRQLYGYRAAFLSLLVITYYELLSGSGFGVGSTDHHAVQIILMLGIVAMVVLPGRPVLRGVVAGGCAALSLAVGLEMILVVALAGVILVATYIVGAEGSGKRLMGFATALAALCPVLMAGQLSPALWNVPVCDALSPPLLAVTFAAFACSAVIVATGRWLSAPLARAAVTLASAVVAAAVLLPMVRPCLAGPYTALSEEIQRTVLAQIEEIRPAGFFFLNDGGRAISLLLPFYLITALFAATVVANRGRGIVILAFLVFGGVLSFWQIRMLNMGLPLAALAFGAGGAWALEQHRTGLRNAGVAAVLFVLLSKPLGVGFITLTWKGPGPITGQTAQSDQCNEIDQLARLDEAPPGIIFNPINIGPIILWATRHSITSAPYHRSADAFANGLLPFSGDEAALREAVERTKSDYILLCKGDITGTKDSIGSQLANGAVRAWLADVPISAPNLRLLRVIR